MEGPDFLIQYSYRWYSTWDLRYICPGTWYILPLIQDTIVYRTIEPQLHVQGARSAQVSW